jgi:hypothetical protein
LSISGNEDINDDADEQSAPTDDDDIYELYWDTDVSTAEIERHFGLLRGRSWVASGPRLSGDMCDVCLGAMAWNSRSERREGRESCLECGHSPGRRYGCPCDWCKQERERERQRRAAEHRARELSEVEEWRTTRVNPKYAFWAVEQLNRRERLFYKAYLELREGGGRFEWGDICDRAGVVSHKRYLNKLVDLQLAYSHPDRFVILNDAISSDEVDVLEEVRRVRPSLRFEIFQRDHHTCQYCGRKAPDVELQIEHLHPVAEGGTDDPSNLVTSCSECNSGKGAKLIADFTKGHSRESWRRVLRKRREEELRRKRAGIDDVLRHWAECRNHPRVSAYDEDAIHRFVETYHPEWIKAAIEVAGERKPTNYVKYVGGILRRWGSDGPPEYLKPPELRSLSNSKPATEKQLAYVRGLLSDASLELADFYPVHDFDALTMADAGKLIDALTSAEEDAGHPEDDRADPLAARPTPGAVVDRARGTSGEGDG